MTAFLTGVVAALAAFFVARRLIAERSRRHALSDDAIRHIEDAGRLEIDEPLDWSEIQDEEERFWSEESWDESDEW